MATLSNEDSSFKIYEGALPGVVHIRPKEERSTNGLEQNSEEQDQSHEQKLEKAGLVGFLTNEEKLAIRDNALSPEKRALIEKEWQPITLYKLTSYLKRIKQKIREEQKLNPDVVFNEEQKRLSAERLKPLLRGDAAEFICAATPLRSAETVYVSIDKNDSGPMKSGFGKFEEIKGYRKYFGTTRKDVITTGYQLTLMEADENYKKEAAKVAGVSDEVTDKAFKTLLEIYKDFDNQQNVHGRNTNEKKSEPDTIAVSRLIRDGVGTAAAMSIVPIIDTEAHRRAGKSEGEGIFGSEDKGLINLVDQVSKTSKGKYTAFNEAVTEALSNVAAFDTNIAAAANDSAKGERIKNAKQIYVRETNKKLTELKREVEQSERDVLEEVKSKYSKTYPMITVPDAFVGDGKHIYAGIEMKGYLKEEIDLWLNWLEQSEDGELISVSGNELIVANGLQVTHVTLKWQPTRVVEADGKEKLQQELSLTDIVTFGPDVQAERNLANLLNGDSIETPIILRLPQDVTEKQIRRLTAIANKKGVTNFVIQKVPFSVNNIHKIASDMVRKRLQYIQNGTKTYVSKTDRDILALLADERTWFEH